MNDLIDEYGPDVKEMYGETLNKSRYTDGKNYYLNNWYGEDPDPVAGVLMRYDYLCEIVGKDRADSDEPFTQEEYIDICKKFKELHPTIDGKESIAITFDAESKNYDGTLKGMYGLKTYYQDGDNLEPVSYTHLPMRSTVFLSSTEARSSTRSVPLVPTFLYARTIRPAV